MNSSFFHDAGPIPPSLEPAGYSSHSLIGAGLMVVLFTIVSSKLVADAKAHRLWAGFPLVSFEKEKGLTARESYIQHSFELMKKGLREVMLSSGPQIILPNKFADEIKKVPQWSFVSWIAKENFADYPGLRPFNAGSHGVGGGHLLVDTVRIKVTQSLNHVTRPLSDYASAIIERLYGSTQEWQSSDLKEDLVDLVTRLSALVFLGKDLASDEQWVEILKLWAGDARKATTDMRRYPHVLLPVLHWFLPGNKKVRRGVAEARQLMRPEIARREKAYNAAIADGKKPAKLYDAIAWVLEIAKGQPVDVAEFQLGLSSVAINTTSEATSFALLDLCENPQYIQELRDEIVEVFGTTGWDKNSLSKLKKMDSFLKESQRFNPVSWSLMRRIAGSELTLSNGKIIPKGANVAVSMEHMYDPDIYPEPEKFDGYRFYRMRQQEGQELSHQFASIGSEHLGFGLGDHACPGRFFAIAEMKIVLCHLLLKYDWKFPDGVTKRIPEVKFETRHSMHPDNRIMFRRREAEISI